jgi:hypothetical protein
VQDAGNEVDSLRNRAVPATLLDKPADAGFRLSGGNWRSHKDGGTKQAEKGTAVCSSQLMPDSVNP